MSNLTPADKFELGWKVRARGDLSPSARLIFAAALDRYNCKTGRCDPGAKTLAGDVAMSERTVRRGLERLQEVRLVWVQPRRGRTPNLHFQHPQNISTTPDTAMSAPTQDTAMSAPEDEGCGQPWQEVRTTRVKSADTAMSDEPLNLGTLKGDALPSPCNGRASASRESQPASQRVERSKGFQEGAESAPSESNDPPQAPQEERARHAEECLARFKRGL